MKPHPRGVARPLQLGAAPALSGHTGVGAGSMFQGPSALWAVVRSVNTFLSQLVLANAGSQALPSGPGSVCLPSVCSAGGESGVEGTFPPPSGNPPAQYPPTHSSLGTPTQGPPPVSVHLL